MNIVIDVEINNKTIPLCIDTGADSSIIYDKGYELMYSMQKDNVSFKHIRNMQISNLNGVQTAGFFELPISINKDSFTLSTAVTDVIDEIDESCNMNGILGMDFLLKNKAIIDIEKEVVILNGKEYKIRKQKTLFLFCLLTKKIAK